MTVKEVTAAFVIIGNEILSGRTKDANLNYLATFLNERGIQLREVRVIPDITATIVETVNELRAKFDYLFTSGGIGPTHDDITSASIAAAFGTEVYRHPDAEKVAGVPKIFQAMLDELAADLVGGEPVKSVTVTTNLGEGVVAEGLEVIQNDYPDMDIGSYPFFRSGVFGTSLVMRSTSEDDLESAAEKVRGLIRSLGQEPLEGELSKDD